MYWQVQQVFTILNKQEVQGITEMVITISEVWHS